MDIRDKAKSIGDQQANFKAVNADSVGKKYVTQPKMNLNLKRAHFFKSLGVPPSVQKIKCCYVISQFKTPFKNSKNGRYVRNTVFILTFELDRKGNFKPLDISPFTLEDAATYIKSVYCLNMEIVQVAASQWRLVGTMGAVERYPVVYTASDANNESVSRIFLVIGMAYRRELLTATETKGEKIIDHTYWGNVPYFLICDVAGNLGWVNQERCLHIGLSYRFANAQVRGSKTIPITPMNYAGPKREFPIINYADLSDFGYVVNSSVDGRHDDGIYAIGGKSIIDNHVINNVASDIAAWQDVYHYKQFNEATAKEHVSELQKDLLYGGPIEIVYIDVSSSELRALRSVADVCMNRPIHRQLLRAVLQAEVTEKLGISGGVTDRMVEDKIESDASLIQSAYRFALIYGKMPKLAYDRMQVYKEYLSKMYGDKVGNNTAFMRSTWVTLVETNPESMKVVPDPVIRLPAFRDMLKTMSPIDSALNIQVYSKFAPEIKSVYLKTLRSEPVVTELLNQCVANIPGTKLEGTDFRIKSPASLSEKVYERARMEGCSTTSALKNLKDALRYTVILKSSDEFDNYVPGTRQFILNLIHYLTLIKFKNYWKIEDDPYQGINSALRYSGANIAFEVQFHTKESYDLKNGRGHELYEKTRAVDTPYAVRVDALKESFKLSKELHVPANVMTFEMKEYENLDTDKEVRAPVDPNTYPAVF